MWDMKTAFKKGDAVEVVANGRKGCRGIIEAVVTVRNEAQRRSNSPGRTFYDVSLKDGEVCRFSIYQITRIDVLDVLADS